MEGIWYITLNTTVPLMSICFPISHKNLLIKNIVYGSIKKRLMHKAVVNAINNYGNVIKAFLLAMVYPLFWVFYLSLPKFQRLDTIRDINFIFESITSNIVIIIIFIIYYFFPLILSWFIFFKEKISNLKQFFWEYTEALFYGLHLKFLKYFIYFKFCEYIYKTFFIFHDIFAGNPGATWNHYRHYYPFYRNIYSHLYFGFGRIYFIIIFFSLIVLEIIINEGKIYYGLYLLFILPIILSLFNAFFRFGESEFILDVCKADYLSLNFLNPRYPRKFWTYMQTPELYFGFAYAMSSQSFENMTKLLTSNLILIKISKKFYNLDSLDRVWGLRYISGSKKKIGTSNYVKGYYTYAGNAKPWCMRLAASYKKYEGVRWFHTTSVLLYPLPEKIHPLTIHFIKNNVYALLALAGHPSLNYGELQKITAKTKFPSPEVLYKNYDPNCKCYEKILTHLTSVFWSIKKLSYQTNFFTKYTLKNDKFV